MAQESIKKYLRLKPEVKTIFDDLNEYLDFCKTYGYVYNENHLYNEKTAWGEMQRVKRGKTPKDNWTMFNRPSKQKNKTAKLND